MLFSFFSFRPTMLFSVQPFLTRYSDVMRMILKFEIIFVTLTIVWTTYYGTYCRIWVFTISNVILFKWVKVLRNVKGGVGLGQRSEISAKELFGTCVENSMSTKITILKSLCDKGELLDVYCIFIIIQQSHFKTQAFMDFCWNDLHGVKFKKWKAWWAWCSDVGTSQIAKGLQDFKFSMLSLRRKYYVYLIMCGFVYVHKALFFILMT